MVARIPIAHPTRGSRFEMFIPSNTISCLDYATSANGCYVEDARCFELHLALSALAPATRSRRIGICPEEPVDEFFLCSAV